MKSWLAKFSGAVVISVVAATFGLAGGILVLRILDPNEAGRYTLMISMATFIGIASLFGQPNLINRIYARSKIAYHWPRDLLNALAVSAIMIVLCLIIVLIFYKLTLFEIGFITAFSFLTAIVNTSAYMLNSYRHYIWSTLLLRLTNALFILPVGLTALGYFKADVNRFLSYQLIIAAGCGLMGIVGLRFYLPMGLRPIPIKERRETFGMAILVFTYLLLDPGLIVVAGYWLEPALLAGFGAYFNLMGPFLLLWSILIQTISVEFGRNPSFPKRKILLTVWALLVPVVALSWRILPKLADLFYKGKYNSYSGIALPISLMGGLLLTEAVPRGFIIALTANLTLRRFIMYQALVAVLVVGLETILVNQFGVYGIAWSGVILLLVRNVIAYWFFLVTRNQLNNSA